MKSFPRLLLLPAFAAFVTAPVLVSANETTARAKAEISEVKGDAAKAALDEINAEIDRLDVLVDSAPDMNERESARARIEVLKERRNDLRKTYVKSRYEELKADIRAEANRLAAWTKRTFNRDDVSNARREVGDTLDDAKRDARRAGDRAVAALDLDDYKNRPLDTDKNAARQALRALEMRIDELDDYVDNLPRGVTRDDAERRVEALEDRLDDLEDNFDKSRFNALVDDVQAETKNLRSSITE
jgi:hypothetical protein